MSGLTAAGFDRKTLPEIEAELDAALKAKFGPAIKTIPTSVVGILKGIFADQLDQLWSEMEAVYASQYRSGASGVSLDYVGQIIGVTRLGAAPSTVTLRLTGDAGVLVPAGSVVSHSSTGDRFETLADVTLVDIGGGVFQATVSAESQEDGPISANAGTLTVIETPIGNWNAVTNDLDADLGRDIETDAAYRLRQTQLLSQAGKATVDAIRAAVLLVSGVQEAFVFENPTPTDFTGSGGLPPHSIQAVVLGGADQDIAEAIFDTKAGGIQAYGSEGPFTVVDDQGFSHNDVDFSRPTTLDIYIDVEVRVNTALFPSPIDPDGKDAVKDAIVAYGDTLGIGDKVYDTKIKSQIFGVSGVLDIIDFKIDTAPGPTITQDIVVGVKEIALFDTSRINVVVTTTP